MYENEARAREFDGPGMVYGFFAGTGMITMVLCLVFASLFLTGCNSPSGPSDPPDGGPVTISPRDVKLAINSENFFFASGGDGQNYNWSVNGGGTVVPMAPTSRAKLITGATPGRFEISVNSGGYSDKTSFEVIATNWLELIESKPPAGSTVGRNARVVFRFRYVTNQPGLSLSVVAFDKNRNFLPMSLTSYGLGTSGETEAIGKFGAEGPVTVRYLRVQMIKNSNYERVAEFWIDYILYLT